MSKQHHPVEFTGRTGLLLAALASVVGSAAFHWIVQSSMTNNVAVALSFTAIFVLAPIIFVGFIFPTSPAGMLVMKIRMRTWGYLVLVLSAIFLIGYDAWLINSWWLTQDVVEQSGYSVHQTVLSIIGFFVLPGLLVSQVSTAEAIEVIRQAHLVKRYEIQTKAQIVILRNTLLRAQEKALIGFANLTPAERDELANVVRGLVYGIGDTLRELVDGVQAVSATRIPYRPLDKDQQIQGYLDHIAGVITDDQPDPGPRSGGPGPAPRPQRPLPEPGSDRAHPRRPDEPGPRDRGDRGGERRPDARGPGGERQERRPAPDHRAEGRASEQRGDQRGDQRSDQRGDRRAPTQAGPDRADREQRPADRAGNDQRGDRASNDQRGDRSGAARTANGERPVHRLDITSFVEHLAAAAPPDGDLTSLFDFIDEQDAQQPPADPRVAP